MGSLEDGTVFDTSREDVSKENDLYNPARPYEPLTFTLGGGQMIPGFDKGVVGMKVGERKVLTIAPADAYGEKKEELIQQVPLSGFTAGGITPQVGETYTIGFAQGTVTAIEGENVTMDFNHFLAGKTLKFDVELVSID
ncbi:MAG: peptidylprolyl isomerase [Candidatus Peribacteria bacterium]|nr:MAG: peptidylprolyl isomerase [Candidatus Peribacteria bacterium]